MFLDLAESVSRQGIDDFKTPRDLEGSKGLAAFLFEASGGSAGLEDEPGDGDFALDGVGLGDDGGFADAGLIEEELFNFAGIDVETGDDDEVGLAAGEREVAVGGDRAEIAGAEPAIDEGSGGSLRAAPVAGEDVGAADVDFAIDDPGTDAGKGEADGAGAALARVGIGDVHQSFRHAVALEDGRAEAEAEVFEELGGEGRGAADEEADGGADFGRAIHEADVHGGDAEEDRGAEGEKLGGGFGGLETLKKTDLHTGGEPAVDAIAEAVDVEEGEGEEETVG